MPFLTWDLSRSREIRSLKCPNTECITRLQLALESRYLWFLRMLQLKTWLSPSFKNVGIGGFGKHLGKVLWTELKMEVVAITGALLALISADHISGPSSCRLTCMLCAVSRSFAPHTSVLGAWALVDICALSWSDHTGLWQKKKKARPSKYRE